MLHWCGELGFTILGLTFSPVKGPEGNIEFLGHLTLADVAGHSAGYGADVVAQAHADAERIKSMKRCDRDPESLSG